MSAIASSIPSELLFDFVKQPQSLDQLIDSLYERPTPLTREHFKSVNGHLGQGVRPGQMVIITPPNARQCSAFEADMMEAARLVEAQLGSMSAEEAKIMAENYALLANVANYSGAAYGAAVNYFKQHKSQVEQILKKIEQLHLTTYKRHGRFNTNEFFQQRKLLFKQLDNTLKTMVGRNRMGLNLERDNLRRSLGLSTKSLAHQLKDYPAPVTDLPGFAKNHAKVQQYGKVLKGAGYVALALDGAQSAAKVKEACTAGREEECAKSKFAQTGRFSGSVAGGAGGGLAGYGLCNLVFGGPTAGTSLLWCGIVVGGAGGFIGGNLVGGAGEALGEVVYETTVKK